MEVELDIKTPTLRYLKTSQAYFLVDTKVSISSLRKVALISLKPEPKVKMVTGSGHIDFIDKELPIQPERFTADLTDALKSEFVSDLGMFAIGAVFEGTDDSMFILSKPFTEPNHTDIELVNPKTKSREYYSLPFPLIRVSDLLKDPEGTKKDIELVRSRFRKSAFENLDVQMTQLGSLIRTLENEYVLVKRELVEHPRDDNLLWRITKSSRAKQYVVAAIDNLI